MRPRFHLEGRRKPHQFIGRDRLSVQINQTVFETKDRRLNGANDTIENCLFQIAFQRRFGYGVNCTPAESAITRIFNTTEQGLFTKTTTIQVSSVTDPLPALTKYNMRCSINTQHVEACLQVEQNDNWVRVWRNICQVGRWNKWKNAWEVPSQKIWSIYIVRKPVTLSTSMAARDKASCELRWIYPNLCLK